MPSRAREAWGRRPAPRPAEGSVEDDGDEDAKNTKDDWFEQVSTLGKKQVYVER